MTHTDTRLAAVDALRTIRDQWGALLAAVETPPADVWPPRQLAHLLHEAAVDESLLVADRAPLTLVPHPAPVNLDAFDAALFAERALFDLADTLAAAVQRHPAERLVETPGRAPRRVVDEADAGDPRRWRYQNTTGPGSRVDGLTFAALWVEGRLLDEDVDDEPPFGALFGRIPEHLLYEAHRVAEQAARRVLRGLRLDARTTGTRRPCPWCGGALTLHIAAANRHPPTVTCETGAACTAPVPLDGARRRAWSGYDAIVDLVHAVVARPAAEDAA